MRGLKNRPLKGMSVLILKVLMKSTVFFLLSTFMAGCTPGISSSFKSLSSQVATPGNPRVSIYFAAVGDCSDELSFVIDSLEVYDGATWIGLNLDPVTIEHQAVRNRQTLLGLTSLPPGHYSKLRLHVTKIERGAGHVSDVQEGATLTLSISRDLNLSVFDSKCLFLNWDLTACMEESAHQLPRISASGQSPSVAGEILYVVCDNIDTLFLVRTDTQFITSSMGFPSHLGDVKYDSARQRLYLVGTSARVVYVIDTVNNQVIDRIPLPSLIQPEFMTLSADGTAAFVTDASTDRIVRLDLVRRTVDTGAPIGISPDRILYFEDSGREQLAMSSKDSQQVYIVNPESLSVESTLSVDVSPGGLLFQNGLLYVCDRGGSTVTVFSLAEKRLLRRINVSANPLSIIGSELGRIYIGHSKQSSLSVIAPQQFSAQRRLRVDYGTFDMAYFPVRQMLYAAHREARKVSVVDLSHEKKINEIAFAGTIFSIEMQD